jgi:hypothetical protein
MPMECLLDVSKYRENLHLYIAKYGADYVKNYPTKKWYMQDLVVW